MATPSSAGKPAEAKGPGDKKKKEERIEGPKNVNPVVAILANIKILGVLKYTSDLVRLLLVGGLEKQTDAVKRLLAIVWPGLWGKRQAGVGRKEIWSMLVLSLLRALLLNYSGNILRQMTQAVFRREQQVFRSQLPQAFAIIAAGSALQAGYNYFWERLGLLWREHLCGHIQNLYFKSMNYYHIANLPDKKAIIDPDERLSREVWSVSQRLTNLVSLLFQALPPIFWFTYRLWSSQGLKFALIPHLYLLLAYEVAQRLFPKNIGDLYRNQAIAQGGYLKAGTRVLNHSEAIAALGGAPIEEQILNKNFNNVSKATETLHKALSKFGLVFKLAYTYGCRSWITGFIMYPIISSPPKEGSLGNDMGDVRRSMQQMVEMLVANGMLLTLHATAQHMGGVSKRICDLIDTLTALEKKQAESKGTTFIEGDGIKFENVQVFTPTGHMLVKDLSFTLPPDGTLLLTGHNGAGKSSIFRCLGGLWNVPQGSITKPGASTTGLHQDIFYLPQKPYNVLGSLQDQITYPVPASNAHLDQKQLEQLLAEVDLSHLLSSQGDKLVNWEEKLSLGEQQRLAMARLFYHRPKYAILDECTSAVSQEMESRLYHRCQDLKISYITICHRPALRAYHTHNLHLKGDGKGGWEMKAIKDIKVKKNDSRVRDLSKSFVHGINNRSNNNSIEKYVEKRSEPYAHLKQVKPLPKRSRLSQLWHLMKIMIPGSGTNFALLAGAIFLRTLCHEGYSWIVGQMYNSLVTRDQSAFIKLNLLNVAQDMTTGLVEESVIYMKNRLSLQWVQHLTEYATKRFFANSAFYNLRAIDKRIRDPDQRLTQEINDLATHFSAIWGDAIAPVVDICWFAVRLYGLIGLQGSRSLGAYIGLMSVLLNVFMPKYENMNRKEKELESRFRFVQTRLRSHAESVAFFGGDQAEHRIATDALQELLQHQQKVRQKDAQFAFVFHSVNKDYSDPSNMLSTPDIVTLNLQLEHATRAAQDDDSAQTGSLARGGFYLEAAANRTINAFGKLTNLYDRLSDLLGSGARVSEMLDVMDELLQQPQSPAAATTSSPSSSSSSLQFDNVDLVTPEGVCLASNLALEVAPKQSLMVTGPNGSGKTSFFRILAGLWPLYKKNSKLIRPPSATSVFLVPQKPYSVSGTLADQVTYPKHIPTRTEEDVKQLEKALEQVGLQYLITREGWDQVRAWENVLSLGEQQRLGLARLFYHQPTFGILDECTDAISAEVEEQLYAKIAEAGITSITISKRLALTEFHQNQLRLGLATENGWDLVPIIPENP